MTAAMKAGPAIEAGEAPEGLSGDSLGAVLQAASGRLGRAGIDSARLDARLLACFVLGWDQAQVLTRPDHSPTAAKRRSLEALVARREKREPLAAITGRREFWGLDFTVNGDTLIPRPESETIIEAALETVTDRDAPLKILDLGTGSGCLLLALLWELPGATGLGVDVSEGALNVARLNASALGLEARAQFRLSDWGGSVDAGEGRFDLLVANPPYVADGEFAALEPEVARFEPRLALSGGPDGLEGYRRLAPGIRALLAPGGRAFVEIGAGQEKTVSVIFQQQELRVAHVHRDLGRRPRVIEIV